MTQAPMTSTRLDARWKRRLLLFLLAALAVAGLLWIPSLVWRYLQPPRPTAPDLTLFAVDGTEHSLSDHCGHPVVLVFVASWCRICRAEMPMMAQAYREHMPHNVIFLAVDSYEDRATVEKFREDLSIPFPILIDSDGAVAQRYHINGTPTNYFIDRDGRVRDVVIGGPLSRSYLEKEIAPLLGIDLPVP